MIYMTLHPSDLSDSGIATVWKQWSAAGAVAAHSLIVIDLLVARANQFMNFTQNDGLQKYYVP